ncbi:MAG: hypothetical protein HKM28_07245 [Flavobacteriaceae bacterium]|nr:hypothetical protein [Flavobacteriaceae bacterium]
MDAYRILNPTRKVQHYVGGELFFNYHENELIDFNYRPKDHMSEIYFDSADLIRQKYGFNFKYGVFIPFAPQFGMNVYVGLGIRIRDNKHENVVSPRMDDYYDEGNWFERYHYYEGTKVLPNLAAGFKLYYKFG